MDDGGVGVGVGVAISDLGTLGGPTSTATAINDVGQVTGWADTSYPPYAYCVGSSPFASHAFRWNDGIMTDLTPSPYSCLSRGLGLNNLGDVAGFSQPVSGDFYPAVWVGNGSPPPLSPPPIDSCAPPEPIATAVNDADEVVGGGQCEPAWLATSAGTISLALTTIGTGNALAINAHGQVVGETLARDASGLHAFLYTDGSMQDLGTLGGSASTASAINDGGTIVGWSTTTGDNATHAFRYSHGAMVDLGTLDGSGSHALAINDCKEIVGFSGGQAFLYRHRRMLDLNKLIPRHSNWTLTTANGINNRHQIVGTGLHNGVQRAYMLTSHARGPRCQR